MGSGYFGGAVSEMNHWEANTSGYKGHPPSCTCVKCSEERLRNQRHEPKRQTLEHVLTREVCPNCGRNLYYDPQARLFRCKNRECKRIFTQETLQHERTRTASGQGERASARVDEFVPKAVRSRSGQRDARAVIPPLVVFVAIFNGMVLSLLLGTAIPFWLLLGFSSIYATERWYGRVTRRYKALGEFYRFVLNLSLLSLLGILVWSCVLLFSGHFLSTQLLGSSVVIGEFVGFIWLWKVVARNSRRWPSMKLTVFSLLAVAALLGFAGVEPLATYKAQMSREVSTIWKSMSSTSANVQRQPSAVQQTPARLPQPSTISPGPAKPSSTSQLSNAEREAFDRINTERAKAGIPATKWDDSLYMLSMRHTQDMADKGTLFHSPQGSPIGEDAWGGQGYSMYSYAELAKVIVDSWMSSPLHKAWLLHAPLRSSVVSIVTNSTGQYSSWTFWVSEAGEGPALVQKVYQLYMAETGGRVEWLHWLYDIKGYPNNQQFMKYLLGQ